MSTFFSTVTFAVRSSFEDVFARYSLLRLRYLVLGSESCRPIVMESTFVLLSIAAPDASELQKPSNPRDLPTRISLAQKGINAILTQLDPTTAEFNGESWPP